MYAFMLYYADHVMVIILYWFIWLSASYIDCLNDLRGRTLGTFWPVGCTLISIVLNSLRLRLYIFYYFLCYFLLLDTHVISIVIVRSRLRLCQQGPKSIFSLIKRY